MALTAKGEKEREAKDDKLQKNVDVVVVAACGSVRRRRKVLPTRNCTRRRRRRKITQRGGSSRKKCMRKGTFCRAIISTTWGTFCRVGNVKI